MKVVELAPLESGCPLCGSLQTSNWTGENTCQQCGCIIEKVFSNDLSYNNPHAVYQKELGPRQNKILYPQYYRHMGFKSERQQIPPRIRRLESHASYEIRVSRQLSKEVNRIAGNIGATRDIRVLAKKLAWSVWPQTLKAGKCRNVHLLSLVSIFHACRYDEFHLTLNTLQEHLDTVNFSRRDLVQVLLRTRRLFPEKRPNALKRATAIAEDFGVSLHPSVTKDTRPATKVELEAACIAIASAIVRGHEIILSHVAKHCGIVPSAIQVYFTRWIHLPPGGVTTNLEYIREYFGRVR